MSSKSFFKLVKSSLGVKSSKSKSADEGARPQVLAPVAETAYSEMPGPNASTRLSSAPGLNGNNVHKLTQSQNINLRFLSVTDMLTLFSHMKLTECHPSIVDHALDGEAFATIVAESDLRKLKLNLPPAKLSETFKRLKEYNSKGVPKLLLPQRHWAAEAFILDPSQGSDNVVPTAASAPISPSTPPRLDATATSGSAGNMDCVPLNELSVQNMSSVFKHLHCSGCVPIITSKLLDGETFSMIENEQELADLKFELTALQFKKVFRKLQGFIIEGVPKYMLTDPVAETSKFNNIGMTNSSAVGNNRVPLSSISCTQMAALFVNLNCPHCAPIIEHNKFDGKTFTGLEKESDLASLPLELSAFLRRKVSRKLQEFASSGVPSEMLLFPAGFTRQVIVEDLSQHNSSLNDPGDLARASNTSEAFVHEESSYANTVLHTPPRTTGSSSAQTRSLASGVPLLDRSPIRSASDIPYGLQLTPDRKLPPIRDGYRLLFQLSQRDIINLFSNLNMPECHAMIVKNRIDGESLCLVEKESELESLGFTLNVLAKRKLSRKLQEFIESGVPEAFLANADSLSNSGSDDEGQVTYEYNGSEPILDQEGDNLSWSSGAAPMGFSTTLLQQDTEPKDSLLPGRRALHTLGVLDVVNLFTKMDLGSCISVIEKNRIDGGMLACVENEHDLVGSTGFGIHMLAAKKLLKQLKEFTTLGVPQEMLINSGQSAFDEGASHQRHNSDASESIGAAEVSLQQQQHKKPIRSLLKKFKSYIAPPMGGEQLQEQPGAVVADLDASTASAFVSSDPLKSNNAIGRSPARIGEAPQNRALHTLTKAEVLVLFSNLNFANCHETIEQYQLNGRDLSFVENEEDLQMAGFNLNVLSSKKLLRRLQEFIVYGIPNELLVSGNATIVTPIVNDTGRFRSTRVASTAGSHSAPAVVPPTLRLIPITNVHEVLVNLSMISSSAALAPEADVVHLLTRMEEFVTLDRANQNFFISNKAWDALAKVLTVYIASIAIAECCVRVMSHLTVAHAESAKAQKQQLYSNSFASLIGYRDIDSPENAAYVLSAIANAPVGSVLESDVLSVFGLTYKLLWLNQVVQTQLGSIESFCDSLIIILKSYVGISALICDACIRVMSVMCRCGDTRDYSNYENIEQLGEEPSLRAAIQVLDLMGDSNSTIGRNVLEFIRNVSINSDMVRNTLGDVGGCEAIIKTLRTNVTNAYMVDASLLAIRNMVANENYGNIARFGDALFFSYCTFAITVHMSRTETIMHVFQVLFLLSLKSPQNRELIENTKGLDEAIVQAMTVHLRSVEVVEPGSRLVIMLAANDDCNLRMYHRGAVNLMLSILSEYIVNPEVAFRVAKAAIAQCANHLDSKMLYEQLGACEWFLRVLAFHKESPEIVEASCNAISRIISSWNISAYRNKVLSSGETCDGVIQVVSKHLLLPTTTEKAVMLLSHIALLSNHAQVRLRDKGIAKYILVVISSYHDNRDLAISVCELITNVCANMDDIKTALGSKGICEILIKMLDDYIEDALAIHQIAGAIWTLVTVRANREMFVVHGVCELLIRCLLLYNANANVANQLCIAIHYVASDSSENKSRLGENGAVAVLTRTLGANITKPFVVRSCCSAILKVAERNKRNRQLFLEAGALSILAELRNDDALASDVKIQIKGAIKALE